MFRRISLGLIGLVLSICACSDSNPTSSNPGEQTVTVAIKDNFFDPKSITVQPGTTVRWVREGSAPDHTVTDNQGAFNSGLTLRNSGDTFVRRFTEAGRTFNYVCRTHESMGMRGSVRVGNNAPNPAPGY